MIYFVYILLAAAVVFLSMKLADYVDMLDKTTKVSGAFIGGVLLAAVTSLPELFTSISATVFIRQNELVLGNILGSNHFNLAVLGFLLILFMRGTARAKVGKNHLVSLIALFVMYGLIALAMFLPIPKIGWFSVVSPLLVLVYAAYIFLTPKTSEASRNFVCKLTFKQIILRFTLASVLLVAASIAITFASDILADKLSLGKTFAGALLLGIATSLPEVVSTFSLCKKKNYDAAFGNIFGSNVFNCTILVIGDLFSFMSGSTDIYLSNPSSNLLLIFGLICSALFTAYLLIKQSKRELLKVKTVSAATVGTLSAASYILFIILAI